MINDPYQRNNLVKTIHALSISEIFDVLGTSHEGLSRDEATARLKTYGPNTIQEVSRQPLILKFLSNFTHLMAVLL